MWFVTNRAVHTAGHTTDDVFCAVDFVTTALRGGVPVSFTMT